jgi:hypothetical protein
MPSAVDARTSAPARTARVLVGDVAAGRLAAYEVLNEAPQLHGSKAGSFRCAALARQMDASKRDGSGPMNNFLALADLSRQ